jgi:hypothetical protein
MGGSATVGDTSKAIRWNCALSCGVLLQTAAFGSPFLFRFYGDLASGVAFFVALPATLSLLDLTAEAFSVVFRQLL